MKISRSRILSLILVAILLGTLPSAIWRLIQSGDPYLFTRQFFEDIFARLSGPGRFRFILQPTVAMLLGARDGVKDARAGQEPFLWRLAFHAEHRWRLIQSWLAATRDTVTVAILLDLVSQALIFRELRPGAALLLGPVLIAFPYALSRALANRIRRGLVPPIRHPQETGEAASQGKRPR